MIRLQQLAAAAALVAFLATAAPAAAQLQVMKRTNLATPVVLGPGQGAIVFGFRRPDKLSMGKLGVVAFARYDLEKRDLAFQPRDAKKNGDTNTYWAQARSAGRKLPLDHAVLVVSAGDYVLFGASPGPLPELDNSFCLGAPVFHVKAGEAVYFGDLTPYLGARMADGDRGAAMAYSSNIEDAGKSLASHPELASVLKPAEISNQATYGCVAQAMLAYSVPGRPSLSPPAAPPAGAEATPSTPGPSADRG